MQPLSCCYDYLRYEALESGSWCCMRKPDGKVGRFEREFAEYIGTKYATCVNAGTSALELAFKSCDIRAG